MSFATAHRAIEIKFYNEWGSRTPISFMGDSYVPVTGSAFVKINIDGGNASQVTIGASSNTFRHLGYIEIYIYVPIATNVDIMAISRAHADYAANIFRGETFSGIICRAPRIYFVGNTKDLGEQEGWYKTMISVPFIHDELL